MIDKQVESGGRGEVSSLNEGASGVDVFKQQPCDQTRQKPPEGHVAPKVGAGAKHYQENAYAS